MPGLIGFFRKNPPGGARAFVEAMARRLEPQGEYQVDLYHEDEAGLGRVSLGLANPAGQPVWNEDRTLAVVVEGEIYNGGELREGLAARGHQFPLAGDPELLLHLYQEHGDRFAADLNGAFVAAVWDRRARRLVVANDRMGLFPLYYARRDDGVMFASGVRALLADPGLPRTVDPVAISEFLVFDHVLEDRTLLETVRLLPQASILAIDEVGLRIRPYWKLTYPALYEHQSEDSCVDELVHHLRRAVKRRQAGGTPSGLLLSGGLDSRILAAMMCEGSPAGSVHSVTWGIPGCDDARFAREVAARVGTKHHFVELKPDWLVRLAERAVQLTDGLGNVVNLHALAPLDEEVRHAKVIHKGFLGDALLGFAIKRPMWADYDAGTWFDVHLKVNESQGSLNYSVSDQERLLTAEFRKQVGGAVYEEYRESRLRSGVSQLANQRLYFDLTQRVPRMTLNGVEVVRSRAVVRLPFADNDLVDFVLTIPPGFLFERHIAKQALIRHYPKLAQIPFTSSGLPLVSCARDLSIRARRLADWHLARIGMGGFLGVGQRPYKDYAGWFRGILRPLLEDTVLSPRALRRGYFDPGYVGEMVSSHMAGTDHAVRLGALLTLELWHRQFID